MSGPESFEGSRSSAPGASSPSTSSQGGVKARRLMLDLLNDILIRHKTLDQAIDDHAGFASLPGRDRALVRMVVGTTLRRLGQIDDMVLKAVHKGKAPSPPSLFNLLRLSVAQIVFMDVPDYAVVDTAVRVALKEGLSRQKGMVNAVLRRVAREYRDWLEGQDEVALNIPGWLLNLWIKDYGEKAARQIAAASLSEAPLDISIKTKDMLDYWAGLLQASILPTGSLRRAAGGLVQDLPGYDEGMWWVQDASAALPAKLFGAVEGKSVIDLCAAPGGKTMQLAAMGANVVALDRSVRRLERLKKNIMRVRLQDHVQTQAGDATVWSPSEPADCVLLDAPCSATGTIRRHPDALHIKKPAEIDRLAALQGRLLKHALTMLKPGGTLIYCTCSLQKAEGEAQIEAFLSSGAPVERVPVDAEEIGGLDRLINAQGDVRILPSHCATFGGLDGFFIARLKKCS